MKRSASCTTTTTRPVSIILIFAFFCYTSLCSIIATAQSTGGYTISNNGATGVNAQKTQLLDFANYNNTTAQTSGGQSFTFTLANGYQLSLTARNVGGTYLGAVACPTITSGTQTPLGYSGYTGLGGKPALYMNNNYNVDMIFSGITLTDANGNTIPNFTIALFDAERTGISGVTETITGITNGGNWAAYESIGTGTFPTQSGIGGTTITWTGNSSLPTAAYAASTANPTQLEVKMYDYEAFALGVYIPMGFVYVHQKDINEENAVDYSFTAKNSSGNTAATFSLNDQSTADNTAYSGNFINAFDLGVGHGAGGDGELWAAAATTASGLSNTGTVSGTLYHRSPGSTIWTKLSPTGVIAVDGAYAGQCVYATSAGVYFYNNGASTQIYSSTTVTDVTCNNGYIAVVAGSGIYTYAYTYSPNSAPAAGGTWTSILTPGIGTRIDMNITATKIFFLQNGTNTVYYTNFSGAYTSIGSAGNAATTATYDVACDDNGNVYATCYDNTNGGTNVVASYSAGTTAWTTELPARQVERLTGGAASQVYGVELYTYPINFPETIWYRATDNTGTAYWIDDERIKNSSTLNGNGIILPVPAGIYTINETLPSSSYDLGRFNIYDPGNATSINLTTNYAQTTVTTNEVVYIEFINEKLNPKAIALTCTQQILQSFDAGTGTGQFGNGSYGTAVEGSAYHYMSANYFIAADGYYEIVDTTGTAHWYSNPGLGDHTGNGGYFLLVNASYAKDEFYRQRVTNLVPGLSYTISFYAANVSASSPIQPNVTYGLQDLSGNLVNTATTGNITSASWTQYSFTFTATTSTADLYLKNVNIGGNGNDIAIDDISINPIIIPLAAITVSPVIKPNVCIGTSYTFSNSQTGGIWTANPTTVATINANNGSAKGKTAGTAIITYTYTNAIGCVSTATTGIVVSAPPTVTAADQLGTGTLCLNQPDSLYSTPSGGATPYTYAWSASPSSGSGLGTATIQNTLATPSAAGSYTYTVVVTDSVGCSATANIPLTVSSHSAPTPSATISAGPYCVAAAITLSASATGGSGTYSYAWTGTPATSTFSNAASPNTTATPSVAGTYTYKVTVNDGYCTVTKSLSAIVINDHPAVTAAGPGTTAICIGGTIALTSNASGGTGPYSYTWSGTATPTSNGGLLSTNVPNPSAKPLAGNYTYTINVKDANGCTASGSTTAAVSYSLVATTMAISASYSPASPTNICAGTGLTLKGAVTTASLSPTYTYKWSGGAGSIANPNSGSTTATTYNSATVSTSAVTTATTAAYTLTVSDGNGCSVTANTADITVNPSPTLTTGNYAPTICYNTVDSVYSLASGGTSPYTYLWTVNGTSPLMTIATPTKDTSSVSGGNFTSTYTFTSTATDANGCTGSNTTTVVSVSGNYNATGPTITNMPVAATACINTAKTFSPTITRGYGAIATYLWTGTPTGNGLGATITASTTITPTAAGSYTYTLKVTDATGCAASATTGTQTVNSAISVSVASSSAAFCGANGSLNLVAAASGGSGSYSNYAWSTAVITSPGTTSVSPESSTSGSATATITGATVGTSRFQYTATVTDNAGGCAGSGSSTILVTGSTPTATVTASSNSTCAGSATVVTLSAAYGGGTAPYNYTWTAPSNSVVTPGYGSTSSSPVTATATATAAQNYVWGLELVDANNCVATGNNGTLALNTGLTVGLTANNYSVCQTPATTINLTGTQVVTTAPYTYTWVGSGLTSASTSGLTNTAKPAATGTYTLTVTDGTGCVGSATTPQSVAVDQATPSISYTCGTNSNGINYGQLYEANGSTWLWTTTSGGRFYTDNTLSVTSDATTSTLEGPFVVYNGLYNVTITDGGGCTGTGSYTISSSSCNVILAVTELGFTAQKHGPEALLAWATASETNNNHFTIQRSGDGITWGQIGTVKAVGNSTTLTQYRFVDASPLNGENYYRLQQVDDNGHESYSQVRQLTFANQWQVQMYPNPAQRFLVLQFNNNMDEKGFITIQSALGSTVLSMAQPIAKGANVITLGQLQWLAQGTYVITLSTGDNIYRAKFVKGGN